MAKARTTVIRRTTDATRRKQEERRAANRAYDQMFVDAAIAERQATQQTAAAKPAHPQQHSKNKR